MWNPKVSIVIPVYNGANFLKIAIDSALSQDYSNLEVIVVNDGSSDNGATEAVANSYGSRISYFSKTNGGVSTALNLGIEKMSGEYFSWLSHDDVYEVNKVSSQIKFLNNLDNKKTVIFSDYSFINEDGVHLSDVSTHAIDSKNMSLDLLCNQSLHGCTLLIHKEVFEKVGNFDPALRSTQDYDMWLRISRSFSFKRLSQPLIRSRVHGDQGSRSPQHLKEIQHFFSKEIQEINLSSYQNILPKLVQLYCVLNSFGNLASSTSKVEAEIQSQFGIRGIVYLRVKLIYFRIKNFLKSKVIKMIKLAHNPRIVRLKSVIKNLIRLNRPVAKLNFDKYFEHNLFNGNESLSGEGSSMDQTRVLRNALPKLLRKFQITTVLDIPCGDWNWMKTVDLDGVDYTGADVVQAIVQKNNANYGDKHKFVHLNLMNSSLPKVNGVFCRDCLVHLNFQDGLSAVKNIKSSKSQYLLMTTFTDRKKNKDLLDGDVWRPLNMQLAPYNFPEPILLLNEECTEAGGKFADKCIGVWKIADL